jgi:hypothetical protein
MENLTIEQIKEELPDVQIKVFNKIVTGHLAGRKNEFAGVWVEIDGTQLNWTFSWFAIKEALANNRPLLTTVN